MGTLIDDGYRLALPAGLSAGNYLLRGQLEEVGASPMVEVADITLRQPTPPLPTHTNDLAARFEAGIVLNGYDVQPPGVLAKQFPAGSLPVVKSGGIIEVTLWWQAESPLDENYHGFVHLVDINGRPIEQVDQVPGPLFQPPMLWRAERPTPDVYSILIPTNAPSGLYWPWAGLYQFPSRKRLAILSVGAENEMGDGTTLDHLQLAPIKIVNRQTMPRAANKVDVAMGNFAKWVGYAMPTPVATVQSVQSGQSLALTLYYESIAPTPMGYTRFVHVVHPTAGLVTQADAIPQQGANPTWAWQRGEIIADPITLTFPPDAPLGEYQLLLGFYAPEADNVRLALQSDEENRVQQENQALIVSVTVAE